MGEDRLSGRCLCGAIRFELSPPIRDVIVCHCRQCARWTGYAAAAAAVAPENLKIVSGAAELKWFVSSDHAQRGFCGVCGSSLFWKPDTGSRIAVLAGSLDPPTGLKVAAHIFTKNKSDYHDIVGEAPKFLQGAGSFAEVHKPSARASGSKKRKGASRKPRTDSRA
jgi:hypothetical protein